ncbi:MAG: hypothetical protein R6V85_16070 [Polyangia bacterium]
MKARVELLAIALLCAASLWLAPCRGLARPPLLRPVAQHTNSGDVHDLLVAGDRIWVATSGGIAIHRRSDGRFRRKITSADGLPSNGVRTLLELEDGSLLAGCDYGTALLEVDGEGQIRVETIERRAAGEAFDPILDACRDRGGSLLLGFQSGPIRVETGPDDGVVLSKAGRLGGAWSAVAIDGAGRLALGALDGGIEIRDDGDRAARALRLQDPVIALAPLRDGFLAATGRALLELRGGRVRPVERPGGAGARRPIDAVALAADRDGVLVGTASGEILRYRDRELSVLAVAGGRISALAAGPDAIWVGVGREGLHRIDPAGGDVSGALRPPGEICSNHVTHLARHRGVLVAATFDQGACALRDGRWEPLAELPSPYVHGLASDGEWLWVASSGGISRYDRELGPLPIGEEDPPALREAARIAATAAVSGRSGEVWINGPLGLLQISRSPEGLRVKNIGWRDGVPPQVTALAHDDGVVLLGSEVRGVTELEPDAADHSLYLDPVHLPEAWVMDVAAAEPGGFWVGTCQRGVARVSDESGRGFGRAQGMPDERIIALAADEKGVFAATLGGPAWIGENGRVESYAELQGLPDPRGAALLLEEEDLWLGTEMGLVRLERVPSP